MFLGGILLSYRTSVESPTSLSETATLRYTEFQILVIYEIKIVDNLI